MPLTSPTTLTILMGPASKDPSPTSPPFYRRLTRNYASARPQHSPAPVTPHIAYANIDTLLRDPFFTTILSDPDYSVVRFPTGLIASCLTCHERDPLHPRLADARPRAMSPNPVHPRATPTTCKTTSPTISRLRFGLAPFLSH